MSNGSSKSLRVYVVPFKMVISRLLWHDGCKEREKIVGNSTGLSPRVGLFNSRVGKEWCRNISHWDSPMDRPSTAAGGDSRRVVPLSGYCQITCFTCKAFGLWPSGDVPTHLGYV